MEKGENISGGKEGRGRAGTDWQKESCPPGRKDGWDIEKMDGGSTDRNARSSRQAGVMDRAGAFME